MKRTSNSGDELARKRRHRAVQKPGDVVYDAGIYPLGQRHNTTPKGPIVQRYVKPSRMPGDVRMMFGEERVAFKGGEGGRGWTVRSTKW